MSNSAFNVTAITGDAGTTRPEEESPESYLRAIDEFDATSIGPRR
jgi:hypothetical protein